MESQFKDASGVEIVPGCKVLIAVVSYGGSPALRRGTVYQISLSRRSRYALLGPPIARIGVEVENPGTTCIDRRTYRRPERMVVIPNPTPGFML